MQQILKHTYILFVLFTRKAEPRTKSNVKKTNRSKLTNQENKQSNAVT